MAQVTNVEETNCSLRGFERNRYFFGKPMTVRDFDAEQRYFNGKRYLLNRLVHSWGVVCGLHITANETGGFKLDAGAAIDCCGHEIILSPEYVKSDVTELEGYRDDLISQTIYLCLKYDECIREPVQTQANVSSCGDVCDYNRIREGFKVIIKDTPPPVEMDFCELATESKVVFEDAQVRIERIVPRWVNPKDVFEVRIRVTPKIISAPLQVSIEETFTPPSQLAVVQGIPALTNRLNFTVTAAGGKMEQRYLLRAGTAPGSAQIRANVHFPSTTSTIPESGNSEVQIIIDPVSEKLVKTYFDEKLEVCPTCTEDHCLYLASAKLNMDGKLSDIEQFPTNQYLYSNPLLYELITCGEQRIGKIPEIPAIDAGNQTVVPAITALKFFKGVQVEDGGVGQANVSASVEQGLKIEANKIVADLGEGVRLDGNKISADTGQGLLIDSNHITADLGDGLMFDGNHIAARVGRGVKIDGNIIAADIGNGLKLVGEQVQPDYSTANEAGKVCQANDPRLSNARTPTPHAATHADGGTDELNVTNLSGVLQDAQRVEVQGEGQTIAVRPRLNFTGEGVTVVDDAAAQERVIINIPGAQAGKVSTGQVRFLRMGEGESRLSPSIAHQLDTNIIAIIIAFLYENRASTFEVFGDATELGVEFPLVLALHPPESETFNIFLKDRRNRTDVSRPKDYTLRWWAIPKTIDTASLEVNPLRQNVATPISMDMLRLHIALAPGITTTELASSLRVSENQLTPQVENLRTANMINIVDGRIFTR